MNSNIQDSVVLITGSDPNQFGTGFVIHKDQHSTYLLTCMHVVSDVIGGPENLKVGSYPAKVIAFDTEDGFDLAVLQVEEVLDIPTLPLTIFEKESCSVIIVGYSLFGHGKTLIKQELKGNLAEKAEVYSKNLDIHGTCWYLEITGKHYLEPGYSGSPVVCETSNHVLGIVNQRKGRGDQGLVISVEALKKIWPEMPSDLLIHQSDSSDKEQEHLKKRRIDAAVPSHAEVGQRIDLLVQVRLPDSPLLSIEEWPTKHQPPSIEQVSKQVSLEFPVDHRTGKIGFASLEVRINAPDFEIHGAAQQFIKVPLNEDSERISFLLTPNRLGNYRINVEVYSIDNVYLGTVPVETVVGGIPTSPTILVANLFLFVKIVKQDSPKPKSKLVDGAKKHPLAILLFNLMAVGILSLLVINRFSLPCVRPEVIILSVAFTILFTLHFVWRFLNKPIRDFGDAIELGAIKIPIKPFTLLLDALHPWRLPNSIITALWVLSVLTTGFIYKYHPSVVCPAESTPIIQNFSVQYEDGTTISLRACETVEVMPHQQILVKTITLNQISPQCTWASIKGSLNPAEGCSILYSIPSGEEYDTLIVLVQSPCKTQETYAGLHVKILAPKVLP